MSNIPGIHAFVRNQSTGNPEVRFAVCLEGNNVVIDTCWRLTYGYLNSLSSKFMFASYFDILGHRGFVRIGVVFGSRAGTMRDLEHCMDVVVVQGALVRVPWRTCQPRKGICRLSVDICKGGKRPGTV